MPLLTFYLWRHIELNFRTPVANSNVEEMSWQNMVYIDTSIMINIIDVLINYSQNETHIFTFNEINRMKSMT